MPVPRVFVSSTYYDLKYLRAAIEEFIRSHGFEPVLFERGNIAYDPQTPLVDSGYRAVETCQIVVLVLGNRYGTLAGSASFGSGDATTTVSVTMEEYRTAIRLGIPTYSFVERSVWAEYQVFDFNREIEDVRYSHEDSVLVFEFVDYIRKLRQNNAIFVFDEPAQIITILRLQWSGLFYDLLRKAGEETRMRALEDAIRDLQDTASRLEAYSETLVRDVASVEVADEIIVEQHRATLARRADRLFDEFRDSSMGRFVRRFHNFDSSDSWSDLVSQCPSLGEFLIAVKAPEKEYGYVNSRESAKVEYERIREQLMSIIGGE